MTEVNKNQPPIQALEKKEDRSLTKFVPLGAQDEVKLSIAMVQNLIAVKTKTGKTCSNNDAIKFIAMCQARRLNPFEGDAFLIGYDSQDGATFSLVTAHQAFLKRAELHPEYNGMKSGIIVKRDDNIIDLEGDFHLDDDAVMGGWATVFFKSRTQPMHKRVRLARFRKNTRIWQDDPAGMICKCAEADALRSSFPTMLGGLFLQAELESKSLEDKPKKPLFGAQAQTKSIDIKSEPVPEQKPITPPVEVLRQLMRDDNIEESTIMEYMSAFGMVEEECPLDKVPADTIAAVIEQWQTISGNIRETENGKDS